MCAGCGAKFTDERWRVAQATGWGRPKDTHPHLCDACKQGAGTIEATAADEQGLQELVRGGARQQPFQRYARHPVYTDCGAEFTDERWRAVEHVGWGAAPELRPSLCEDCDRQAATEIQQAWPGAHRQQEQGQAVLEQKTGSTWVSRFRR